MTTPSKEGNDPCSNENSEESESDADMDEVLLAEFEDNDTQRYPLDTPANNTNL